MPNPTECDKPRVLMVGPTPPPIGGIATQVGLLLDSSLRDHFAITHLDPGITPGQGMPRRLLSSMGLTARFLWGLWSSRARIVHLHSSSFTGFYEKGFLALLAKLAGKKAILHLHGGGFQKFWDASHAKWLIAWILRSMDAVLVLSEGWKAAVLRMSPSSQPTIIPTSIPTGRYYPPLVREDAGLRVVFVGWMDRNKGIFDLLEAVAGLHARWPDLRVDMIGSGRDMGAFKVQVEERGLAAAFRIHGWVDESVKVDKLRSSDIFVLPSHVEGLPTALLEAMAAGLPVVSTTVGAIPEVVRQHVEGELVAPRSPGLLADALVRLCEDHDARSRYGHAAAARAQAEYDIERSAERVAALYRELLGGAK